LHSRRGGRIRPNTGLASFPVAELISIGIANVDTVAKDIAENADIAIGAKVRMSKRPRTQGQYLADLDSPHGETRNAR